MNLGCAITVEGAAECLWRSNNPAAQRGDGPHRGWLALPRAQREQWLALAAAEIERWTGRPALPTGQPWA